MQIKPRPVWHDEKNPAILSALLDMANAEILRLKKVVDQAALAKARAEQNAFTFEESLRILRKKFFGKSSEKSISDRRRSRKEEDQEVLLHTQNLLPPLARNAVRDLDEEIKIHEMTASELKIASLELAIDEANGSEWEKMDGFYEESIEIEIVERAYKKIKHRRQKYKLKPEFNTSEKESIIIAASGPQKLLPGATYSIDLAVSVVVDKYVNHIPLERQVRTMDSLGLKNMNTNTLYNLARVTSEYLDPIAKTVKDEILSLSLVHADETPWPINNKKDSDGYMWIISNQKGSYYRFEPTRSGMVIKETLGGYQGIVMSDGYSGYTQFKNENSQIKSALCHAHARRYFWDIVDDNPDCLEYLKLYENLFKIEHRAKSFAELKILRQQESLPLIKQMEKWLIDKLPQARSETALLKAINYSLNNWVELIKFLDNQDIPLTNNEAERTIRHAVMGRKNFYGSRSIDGADVTAILYSIIESCKKVEIDPRDYLLTTIRNAANGENIISPFETAKNLRGQSPL